MKKSDLKKLALMGLSSGVLMTNQVSAQTGHTTPAQVHNSANLVVNKCSASTPTSNSPKVSPPTNDPNDGNMNFHIMTEDELMIELNPQGIDMYNKLPLEGKTLGRKLASMMCNGTNPCMGLNSCQTTKNDCAGKGACKGQGKCAISDKNLAIKLVSEKMAGKRDAATRKPN
jgi:hypothetical protein